jgi:GAF domain-containing protein
VGYEVNEVDTEQLARTFVSLADTLVDDFDMLDVLGVLTSRCVDLLGAAAAGLLLADEQGRLRVTVASSERARLMDLFQLQNDEGPCLDCFRTGELVAATSEQAHRSWPRFADAAAEEGFVTVLALPLRLRRTVVGALNLFGDSHSPPISEREVPIAQALADAATIAILHDQLLRDRELLAEQLQYALQSRIAIEQAKGVIIAQKGVGPDEAFDLLRTHARSSRQRLVEVAEGVVRRSSPPASPKPTSEA